MLREFARQPVIRAAVELAKDRIIRGCALPGEWFTPMIEDMLVLDAGCVAYVPHDFSGWRPVNGAGIQSYVDDRGRTPLPPAPAYRYVNDFGNGNVRFVANFTTNEMIYRPRNPVPWSLFGHSPVEEVAPLVKCLDCRQWPEDALDRVLIQRAFGLGDCPGSRERMDSFVAWTRGMLQSMDVKEMAAKVRYNRVNEATEDYKALMGVKELRG